MDQPDFFAEPQAPAWRPDPEKVRDRLRRILGEAREAETVPWAPTQVNLYRKIVPDMSNWLPEDEAAQWRALFEAELLRLGVEDPRGNGAA